MATYSFQSITAAQGLAYSGATDSVTFGAGEANQAAVAFLTAPESAAVSFGGRTVNFGPGVYSDLDLRFDNGGIVFVGGTGADNATGSAAGDAMFGGAGGDTLNGGGGANIIQGNQGNDSLVGGSGNDTVYGGQDNDTIVLGTGSAEANFANGNRGDDTITASNGADTVLGGQGNDLITGGNGGQFLNGNLGDDTIAGGSGADTISGEGGYDVLTGGAGADQFVFAAGTSDVSNALADRIRDWSAADRIGLSVHGGYSELVSAGAPAQMPMYDPYDPYGYYDYPAAMSADFTTATSTATNTMAADRTLQIVAVQYGADVSVFVDTNADHTPDMAIVLLNTSLAQIDATNFF